MHVSQQSTKNTINITENADSKGKDACCMQSIHSFATDINILKDKCMELNIDINTHKKVPYNPLHSEVFESTNYSEVEYVHDLEIDSMHVSQQCSEHTVNIKESNVSKGNEAFSMQSIHSFETEKNIFSENCMKNFSDINTHKNVSHNYLRSEVVKRNGCSETGYGYDLEKDPMHASQQSTDHIVNIQKNNASKSNGSFKSMQRNNAELLMNNENRERECVDECNEENAVENISGEFFKELNIHGRRIVDISYFLKEFVNVCIRQLHYAVIRNYVLSNVEMKV